MRALPTLSLSSGWGGIDEANFEKQQERLIDLYFGHLRSAASKFHPDLDMDALEHEWRDLFPFALADFHRFADFLA